MAPEITGQLEFLVAIVQTQQTTIENQQAQLLQMNYRLMAIENPDDNDDNGSIDPGLGSTYVRWGRTVCPDTAQLVYEGKYIG